MQRVEEMQAPECCGDRQPIFLYKAAEMVGRLLRPAAATDNEYRLARRAEELGELRHLGGTWRGLDRRERRRIFHGDALGKHVFGQTPHTRPQAAIGGG